MNTVKVKLAAPIKLITKDILKRLPPLYSQENNKDPIVWIKFFTPDANWTWYGIEFDGEDMFFGYIIGHEKELGYFSLAELQTIRGKLGLPVERDKWFKPTRLSEVRKKEGDSQTDEPAQGRLFDYQWLAKKLNKCNLKPQETDLALNWKPLRELITWAVRTRIKTELCSPGMVAGVYQLYFRTADVIKQAQILKESKKVPWIKRVYSANPDEIVFEITVPDNSQKEELTWNTQQVIIQPKKEAATQAALFEKCNRNHFAVNKDGKVISKAKIADPELAKVAEALVKTEVVE